MTAPFLLDTCACIYIVEGTLGAGPARLLTEAYSRGLESHISPFSAWELAMLASKKRLRLSASVEAVFRQLVSQPGFALAPLSPEILIQACFLPDADRLRDPADRIIAATARTHGYAVMTRDRPLLDYAAEGHLRAIPC